MDRMSAVQAADAIGVSAALTGLPGMRIDSIKGEVTFTLPGVDELTPEQQASARVVAEWLLTGQERWPGLLSAMVANGGLPDGKRALMVEMVQSPSIADPIASFIRLVAYIATEAVNHTRENPVIAQRAEFADVLAMAVQMIQQGAAD